jgi:lipoyl(octanoyl) transferase
MGARVLTWHWLGRIDYVRAHALQEQLLEARIRGAIGNTVLFLEHDAVITLGRSGRRDNVLASPQDLADRGIQVIATGRGGDVTYHGPGQLVAYPILDLRPDRCDVRRYVRDLARVMIALARRHGMAASFLEGDPSLVGVWVDEASPALWRGDPRLEGGAQRPAKIGAIGVRISRWCTMHGFAYNVAPDLSAFGSIVPCGLTRYGVTSVAALAGTATTVERAARDAAACFEAVFEATATGASASETAALLES